MRAQFRQFEIIYVFGESFRSDLDLARRLPFGHTDFVVNPDDVVQAVDAAIRFRSSSDRPGRIGRARG